MQQEVEKYFKEILHLPCPYFVLNLFVTKSEKDPDVENETIRELEDKKFIIDLDEHILKDPTE